MENNIKVVDKIKEYCVKKPGVYETRPFGKYPICYRVMGKIFAQLNPQKDFYKITLKCSPEQAYVYRELYPNVIVRGYHCPPVQQPYWNTINLYNFHDENILFQMIDEAYEEIVCKMTKKGKRQFETLSRLRFIHTNGNNKDFTILCNRLEYALDEIVGESFDRTRYAAFNTRENMNDAIVVYRNNEPIGCGAIRGYDDEHVELKRVFTVEEARGIGLGEEIIRRLEAIGKIQGYKYCILETGKLLKAACHIYKKMGYQVIPNYGPYEDMPNSICMQKKI